VAVVPLVFVGAGDETTRVGLLKSLSPATARNRPLLPRKWTEVTRPRSGATKTHRAGGVGGGIVDRDGRPSGALSWHDTFIWPYQPGGLRRVFTIILSACSVLRTAVCDPLCTPLCCEFRVRGPGLCSLPPPYLVEAKPECSWITAQPIRRSYSPSRCYGTKPRRCQVAHRSRSPDTFSGNTRTRRLLYHCNFCALGRLSLQLQARHL